MTVAAFGYRLIAPMNHVYLGHPLRLAIAVDVALLVGLSLRSLALPPCGQLWLTLLLAGSGTLIPSTTIHANLHASLAAVRALWSGRALEDAPPGGLTPYPWRAYQETLDYIRTQTTPATRIANLLRRDSPSLCGPTRTPPGVPGRDTVARMAVADEHPHGRRLRHVPHAVVGVCHRLGPGGAGLGRG